MFLQYGRRGNERKNTEITVPVIFLLFKVRPVIGAEWAYGQS